MYKTFSVTNGHGQIFYYAAYSQHDAERQAHLDIGRYSPLTVRDAEVPFNESLLPVFLSIADQRSVAQRNMLVSTPAIL